MVAVVSIDAQLYVLTGGLATLGIVAARQAWRLRTIYRSHASWIGAITFLLLAGRQIYALYRLQHNIKEARLRGYMIERLTAEQWIVGVLWGYAIMGGFVLYQHYQHRDLKKLGI